jgi:hypothetical protein
MTTTRSLVAIPCLRRASGTRRARRQLRFAALGVTHIVFGHQPSALGATGEIAMGAGGTLFRIDCGMSPDVNYSDGRMMRVHTEGDVDVAESLQPDGSAREIWRSAPGQ